MPNPLVISRKDARNLALNSQGLLKSFDSSLTAIKQLSYIQINTISVTERAHHHVLFSRNSKYHKDDIIKMMADKTVFEYWSHAAAYLPMQDFRFSLYPKEQYKNGDKHWFPRDNKVEKYVLDRIKAEGPLQSNQFDHPKNKNHEWYEWKPSKIALTNLFMDGSLMISNRKGFQKIFDLTQRVIPSNINTTLPILEEYCEHLIVNAINAHGLVNLNEICYLRKGIKPTVKKLLHQLTEAKEIIPVCIEKNDSIYYSTAKLIEESTKYNIPQTVNQLHILSPFDNLIIQRKRVKELFNFNYQIECYVPEKKRKFGYYALPVLYGDKFIARFDAKADRKTKLFTLKGIWFEEEFEVSDEFYNKFSEQLISFAKFCGCEKIKLNNACPSFLKKELKVSY